MKILHLMKKEKFLNSARNFYNIHFDNNEHTICYINFFGEESLIDRSISIPQIEIYFKRKSLKNIQKFKKVIKEYDFIVFHSLQFVSSITNLIWLLPQKYLSRFIWIEWGADLYKDYKGIASVINSRFKTKIGYYIAIFPPDIDVFKAKFPRSKAKLYYAPYIGPYAPSYMQDTHSHSSLFKKNGILTIQIGQNANEGLHHIETLDILKKFKDENIQIIMPMNYGGNKEYVNEVEKHAVSIFGDKVQVVKEFLPVDQYWEMMKNVDIAIFHTDRQAGLGNIHRALWHDVKVYLCENGVMYQYFRKRGAPVQRIENIVNESFIDFSSTPILTNDEILEYQQYRKEISNIDYRVDLWRKIYDELRNNQEKK